MHLSWGVLTNFYRMELTFDGNRSECYTTSGCLFLFFFSQPKKFCEFQRSTSTLIFYQLDVWQWFLIIAQYLQDLEKFWSNLMEIATTHWLTTLITYPYIASKPTISGVLRVIPEICSLLHRKLRFDSNVKVEGIICPVFLMELKFKLSEIVRFYCREYRG